MTRKSHIRQGRTGRGGAAGLAAVLLVAFMAAFGAGCNDDENVVIVDLPPSAPDGVFSTTGDGEVEICWNPNPEPDVKGYDIFWNDQPVGVFERIGSVGANQTCFVDVNVANGVTYYYAVAAFDEAGQQSDLSVEDVFDTPRPEGTNLVLFDYLGQNSNLSGYDFSALTGVAQAMTDPTTDVYFGAPGNVPTLFADQVAGVDIQDYGYVDLVDVDWAPLAGWSGIGQVELIQGHSYIIRVVDAGGVFHMAKVFVVDVSTTSVTLDWAYQIDPNNPELAPGTGGAQR